MDIKTLEGFMGHILKHCCRRRPLPLIPTQLKMKMNWHLKKVQ